MTAFKLTRWFQPERYANRPEDDFVREEILNDLASPRAVAVTEDGTIFVETETGACAVERKPNGLVTFDYVRNDRWERTAFWMNASSVTDLGDVFRAARRVTADEIFTGVTA